MKRQIQSIHVVRKILSEGWITIGNLRERFAAETGLDPATSSSALAALEYSGELDHKVVKGTNLSYSAQDLVRLLDLKAVPGNFEIPEEMVVGAAAVAQHAISHTMIRQEIGRNVWMASIGANTITFHCLPKNDSLEEG